MLSIAASKGWIVFENDVETAFLNAAIEEDVYMDQPLGHEERDVDGSPKRGLNGKKLVCKLLSAIYGTKQAGRNWYKAFSKPILEFQGMKQCDVDPCLFVATHGAGQNSERKRTSEG